MIIYGRARDPKHYVLAESDGKTYRTRPARGGAFLFVFAGRASTVDAWTHPARFIKR